MATSTHISIKSSEAGPYDHKQISSSSAKIASEILQDNHEMHHIFSSPGGFHNHIVHHILTVLALGADPPTIQKHYLADKSFQRPLGALEPSGGQNLSDPETFAKFRGDNTRYVDFLEFFQQEVDKNGYQSVVTRYLFAGDEFADEMLERFMTLHPLIHLGCAIEFSQPPLMIEALAETAVHPKRVGSFLTLAEQTALSLGKPTQKRLIDILEGVEADEKIIAVTSWDEPKKLENGPHKKAVSAMRTWAGMWNVGPGQLEEKMSELLITAAFVAGAAQCAPKIVKLDFFLIHCLTNSHFLIMVSKAPWISEPSKVRMVEWMGRLVVAVYAVSGLPKLYGDEIRNYEPKLPDDGSWDGLVERAVRFGDDGHASKVVRALMNGEEISRPFGESEWVLVRGEMWRKIGHMCMDSVENADTIWVRFAGFKEAWAEFPDRGE